MLSTLFAQTTTTVTTAEQSGALAFLGTYLIAILALVVIIVIAEWKIFVKAGRPGWECLIPIYSLYVLLKYVTKQSPWWILAALIPYAGSIVLGVVIAVGLAKAFGKSTAFAIFGLFLFSFVGYLILGFGHDKWVYGEAGAAPMAPGVPMGPQPTYPGTPMPPAPTAPQPPVAPAPPTAEPPAAPPTA